jgi:hypothetical protein
MSKSNNGAVRYEYEPVPSQDQKFKSDPADEESAKLVNGHESAKPTTRIALTLENNNEDEIQIMGSDSESSHPR